MSMFCKNHWLQYGEMVGRPGGFPGNYSVLTSVLGYEKKIEIYKADK